MRSNVQSRVRSSVHSILYFFVSNLKKGWCWVRFMLIRMRLLQESNAHNDSEKTNPLEKIQSTTAQVDSLKNSYFIEARSWADDMYTSVIVSRNRYKLAFFIAMGLAILLTIAINGLIPMQHMEPLLINHYSDGRVSVQPMAQRAAPTLQAQVESDLVQYVINRESYDASSYDEQYSLINLMSDAEVARQYRNGQSTSNIHSPINILGNQGSRTVHVDSVVFLDSTKQNIGKLKPQQTHHNVAQVNFTVTDHVKSSSIQKTKAYTALLSWAYRGTPSDPNDRWRDWNGFTVTRFTKEQRNV